MHSINAAILAALMAAGSASAKAEPPRVGDTIRARAGESVRGWQMDAAGLGIDDQTFALFRRGNSFIVALTTPVTRDPKGGHQSERITKTVSTRILPGEEALAGIDCGWTALGRDGAPVIAFYNAQRAVARGYFTAKNRIFMARWAAKPEDCKYQGD